jgi:hypothetical protein
LQHRQYRAALLGIMPCNLLNFVTEFTEIKVYTPCHKIKANQYRVVLEHDTQQTPGLAGLDSVRLTSREGHALRNNPQRHPRSHCQ